MIWPMEIAVDEMPLRLKEWALVGCNFFCRERDVIGKGEWVQSSDFALLIIKDELWVDDGPLGKKSYAYYYRNESKWEALRKYDVDVPA